MAKSTEATRTIVELDLVGYSKIVSMLEQNLGPKATMQLNKQIQGFVDEGLRAVDIPRNKAVNSKAGDNAVVVFERVSEAHRFAEAFHRETERYNAKKTEVSAKRWFRLGIATGEIAIEGNEIAGLTIINSCRLEAGGEKGHILVDTATYEELPARFHNSYIGPESLTDKGGTKHQFYRYVVVQTGKPLIVIPGAPGKDDSHAFSSPAHIREKIDTILQNSPQTRACLSKILKVTEAELSNTLLEKRFSDSWYLIAPNVDRCRDCFGDIKRILFLLASSEVDKAFASNVEQQIKEEAKTHIPVQTRYKAVAELFLAAALEREPRWAIRKKDGRLDIAGEDAIEISEESGITCESKRRDVVNGLKTRFDLNGITEAEIEERLGKRLLPFIKSNNPVYVAHHGPKPLSIPNLVEFLFPQRGEPSNSTAHTATDEETIMGLLENILLAKNN